MRYLLIFFIILMASSCNNAKIEKFESDIGEIKQSLERIEAVLGSRTYDNSQFSESYSPKNNRSNLKPGATQGGSTKITPYLGRCQATTKKGSQCSRKARSAGYCWQHGG